MKISFKIFIMTYCLLMVLTAVGGFLIINNLYHSEYEQKVSETERTMNMLTIYISSIEDVPEQTYKKYSLAGFERQIGMTNNGEMTPFVGDYEMWEEKNRFSSVTDLKNGETVLGVVTVDGEQTLQISRRLDDYYLIVYGSLRDVFARRESNYQLYRKLILASSVVVAVILLVFSSFITRPISKITKAAEQISAGDYSVRVDESYRAMRSCEVQSLGITLNELASRTEDYIGALQNEARKQEDFVGNFTHEIKTPLTSIIGYADLLRSGNISQDKQYEYSNFIYREGKRLEQMSFHLLDLIVMDKADFELSRISIGSIFKQLQSEAVFIEKKYSISIVFRFDKAHVMAEPALLIAMLINLLDNAGKASQAGGKVMVIGVHEDKKYRICVSDEGYGIPEDQIDKIKEPFYMVDKSRARKQGGAGLGLALCTRIAKIHNSELNIVSTVGVGTDISVTISCAEDNKEIEYA